VDYLASNGWRPLSAAALYGREDVVDFLIGVRANVNWAPGTPTALTCAAQNGHLGIVERLLEAGADPNSPGLDARTPLFLAVSFGHREVVARLLSAKAFADARAANGSTPLHFAVDGDRTDIAELLVDSGASLGAMDNDGDTPLHRAAVRGNVDFAAWLLDRNADIDRLNSLGKRPVDVAKNVEMVEFFRGRGVSIPEEDLNETERANFLSWEPALPARIERLRSLLKSIEKDSLLGSAFAVVKNDMRDISNEKYMDDAGSDGIAKVPDAFWAGLPFYPRAYICAVPDILVRQPNQLFFIVSEDEKYIEALDWTNEPIFKHNERFGIAFASENDLKTYFRFFFFFVRGHLGRFVIVERASEVAWLKGVDSETLSSIEAKIHPIEMFDTGIEYMAGFQFTCTFKNALFETQAFLALRSLDHTWPGDEKPTHFSPGQMELRNEELLNEDLPIEVPRPSTRFG
jgi:ankyrin repeat protein